MEVVLGSLEPWVVYLAVGVLTFGESAFFLSLIMPGEVGLIAAAALAAAGGVDWLPLVIVAAVGATAGGLVAYELSHRYRERVLAWGPATASFRSHDARLTSRLGSHGGMTVVVLGRFNQVTRALVPAIAGVTSMKRRQFLVANLLGAVLWAGAFTALGYFASDWWMASSTPLKIATAAVAILALGVGAALTWSRGDREIKRCDAAPPTVPVRDGWRAEACEGPRRHESPPS